MPDYRPSQVIGIARLISKEVSKLPGIRTDRGTGKTHNYRYRSVWTCECTECSAALRVREDAFGQVRSYCTHVRKERIKKKYVYKKTNPILDCSHCGRRHSYPYKCRLKDWNDRLAALPIRDCAWCGEKFKPIALDQTCCSPAHNKKLVKCRRGEAYKRRARQLGVVIEDFNPKAVFDRDQWKCKICGIDTPKDLRGTYLPNAPELDHILPLSLGGSHSENNVRCLCRKCNYGRNLTLDFILALAVYKAFKKSSQMEP